MTRLDSPASCVDYSPDGEFLIVGLGARIRSNTDATSATTSSGTTIGASSGGETGSERWGRRGKRGDASSSGGGSGGSEGGAAGTGAKTGGFVVLNEADFVTVFEARDAKKVRS